MILNIYNTLTKKKEVFKPITAEKIRLYVCGMTVYDYCHIGHARMLIVFDMIVRYLRYQEYNVTYVRNITDIDDKIIKRAIEQNVSFQDITTRYIQAFHEDAHALNLLAPDIEPLATEHMPQIIAMIETLIEKEAAYATENGDVYFQVSQFPAYGQLSKQNLNQLRAGARVDINESKRDPLDFALWKASKPNEPSWDSPWGKGRPGWHIECSAMSTELLGNHFDIHGGGHDLTFPHHENEIAQSEAATGCKFANTWIHVGFLQINDEKMSKSLGNFFTIREVLARYAAETIRFFMLSSHYRSPLNFSDQALDNAEAGLTRLYLALRDLTIKEELPEDAQKWQTAFANAMNDDFNTAEALAVLFELAREINKERSNDSEKAAKLGYLLKTLGAVLGLLQQNPEDFLRSDLSTDEMRNIEQLVEEREQARKNKQWETADKLRNQLSAIGVTIEDTPQGTFWRKK